jgi:hypothetical protein
MAYSFEDVMKKLGDDAQSVAGNVIVRHNNQNVKVAYYNPEDGGFVVTDEGKEILDGLADAGKKAPAKEAPAKPAAKASSIDDKLDVLE